MADLIFFTGPMDCGKSTLALQMDHTQRTGGRLGLLLTREDRSGAAVISSRLGLQETALEVNDDLDLWTTIVRRLTAGERIDYLICDESQFFTPAHVDQLARLVDELRIDVFAFGILTDFRTELFPGSRRLVELADRIETLQVQPLCWCGQRATHNARTIGGRVITEGSQVVVGDTVGVDDTVPAGEVAYEVLCRRHHRLRMSRAVAQATLSPDPLPFGQEPLS
ncbi:thymidine kinase [Granulicoccus sp. GXG6511]|uniref:thymidine kinase n=1 Tax=Granulicoccus sp. GXG6511 TaxID=3381351 RepID=UPI003D7DB10C